jgi:hypothetical protein
MGYNQIQTETSKDSMICVGTLYSSVWVHRRSGRTYHPIIQGRRVNQARNKEGTCFNLLTCFFFYSLAHFSTQNLQATRFSEKSMNVFWATRCYNPIVTAVRTPTPAERWYNIAKCCILLLAKECCWLTTTIFPFDWWRSLITLNRPANATSSCLPVVSLHPAQQCQYCALKESFPAEEGYSHPATCHRLSITRVRLVSKIRRRTNFFL